MSKVTLPKEVAEAIATLRAKGYENFTIMRMGHEAVFSQPDLTIKRWAFDDNGAGNPDLLMSALVNGYEIEQSPEDKLREYYEGCREAYFVASNTGNLSERRYQLGKTVAIKEALRILGIKIEGINADSTMKEAGE